MTKALHFRALAFFISLCLGRLVFTSDVSAETSILLTLMKASQSVVQIESENTQTEQRFTDNRQKKIIGESQLIRKGTGIIIDSRGIIATNAHVVLQAARIRIQLPDGNNYDAKPLLVDRENDLCLLRILPTSELTALPLADVSKVALQSKIYSIGGSHLLRNSLSEGKVTGIAFSKKNNKKPRDRLANDIKLFQINIDLYQGDSGSPIFNASGEIIGIISAAAQRRGKTAFAIPSSLISARLQQAQSAP